MYDNHKVKPLHVMLSKRTAYVKSNDGQAKWIYFLIENITLIGIKSELIYIKKLIASLSIISIFKNKNKISWR